MGVKRLNSRCIDCLLNKHLKNIPNGLSSSQKLEYMQGILKIVGNADVGMSVPEIVAEINEFKKAFGKIEDFAEIKRFYNSCLLDLEKEIENIIESSTGPLEDAVKYAMAGNYIDFGTMESVDEQILKETLENANKIAISKSEFDRFKSEINNAKSIVYLVDNCGEIVLDKLLIKQILNLNKNVKVDVIVRGEPVLNDCTIEDAVQVGLDKISTNVKELIDNADLIISKGQGNFETLHHCEKNIYYLFLCKCEMFAQRFGVPKFTGVFINDSSLF